VAPIQYIVEGGHRLRGAIEPSGNKNSALPIIAAALLTEHPVTLDNVPRIRDTETLVELIRSVGASAEWRGRNRLAIHAKELRAADLDPELCARIRASILLAGPLLLGAVLSSRARAREHGGEGPPGARPPAVAVAVLILIAVWVVWGPVRETLAVAGSQDTSAAYYVPVERFIAAVPDGPVRVEVPLTRSHWEAALLAPSVSLARGWEKQLETRYAHPLLSPGPAAASYRAWLSEQAVSYVALPDASLDSTSMQEGRLIRGGLPYLRLVFASRHWRIYRVLGATPILTGPGRLQSLGHDSFTVRAHAAGRLLVRVHFTPYWTVTAGRGCVQEAPGGWTEVVLGGPGTVTVAARFSFARAFSGTGSCPGVDRRSRESAPTSG